MSDGSYDGYGSYNGPTLRSVRESAGIALRAVARFAKMSHGHLSKVERGEPGRPVTPTVLRAYQATCGVQLVAAAGQAHAESDRRWRRGQLSEARRQILNAKIAAVGAGGPLGEQASRILDATGRIVAPVQVYDLDGRVVEQVAAMCTRLDLQFGGGLCDQHTRALLRWAVGLLSAEAATPVVVRLYSAVGWLAQRAGWAAFDADWHDIARSLFTIGLYAATRADDPNLRAHIVADFAVQYNHLGYPSDALTIVRYAEVDERVGPHLHTIINTVKARAYAANGEADACRRHLDLAADMQAKAATSEASEPAGWVTSIATRAQLAAATGHALATLARRSGDPQARTEAVPHLTTAAENLGQGRARAVGLCQTQLAIGYLEAGEFEPATGWARKAIDTATSLRSARLVEQLRQLRAIAAGHHHEPAMRELAADLGLVTDLPPPSSRPEEGPSGG